MIATQRTIAQIEKFNYGREIKCKVMTHSHSFDAVTLFVQRAQGFASDMKSNKWKLYRIGKNLYVY